MSSEKTFSRALSAKELYKKALSYKYFYITALILLLGGAYLLNKYGSVVYQTKATILLNPQTKNPLLGSNDLFSGFDMLQSNKNIENEISVLKSFSMVSSTLSQLGLEVSYKIEKKGLIKIKEDIYQDSPFMVTLDKSHAQAVGVPIFIEVLTDSTYRLYAESKEASFYNYIDNRTIGRTEFFQFDEVGKFGKTFTSDYFKFDLVLTDKQKYNRLKNDCRFYIELNNLDHLTRNYQSNMRVEAASSLSSIIVITLKGDNSQKITDFVNKYVGYYLDNNLQKKNKMAQSSIKFIDSQLSNISDSLSSAESNLQSYRTANQVMDLSFQGKSIYEKMSNLETEKANLMIQKRYYDYILDYVSSNKSDTELAPPSTANVMDPILSGLISRLIELNTERAKIPTANAGNVFLSEIDQNIRQVKETIRENVKNNLNTLNINLNELTYRSGKLSNEISRLPKTELQLINIERKFKLNNEILTFLLQKRSEAEILKASNVPDFELVDISRESLVDVVAPKRSLNFVLAFMLAFLIPTGFVVLKDFLNDKILDTSDIERITNAPVIGTVFKNRKKTETVVADYPRTSIAESFRTIRTNLQIKAAGALPQVVLLTSTMSQEGKSFVSLNLALSFASYGSKVVLLGFDLRRPVLHEKLQMKDMLGLSSYLLNKAVLDDILIKTKYDNLDFIPSGPVMPNPSEILNTSRLDKIFNTLKEKYDYIIVDTAPLGPVADTFLLMRFATENIVVTRQNFTTKDMFYEIIKSIKNNNVKNVSILLNDFNIKKSTYGYDYKYYGNEK